LEQLGLLNQSKCFLLKSFVCFLQKFYFLLKMFQNLFFSCEFIFKLFVLNLKIVIFDSQFWYLILYRMNFIDDLSFFVLKHGHSFIERNNSFFFVFKFSL